MYNELIGPFGNFIFRTGLILFVVFVVSGD